MSHGCNDGREMYKIASCTYKFVVLSIKTFYLFAILLSSPSSLVLLSSRNHECYIYHGDVTSYFSAVNRFEVFFLPFLTSLQAGKQRFTAFCLFSICFRPKGYFALRIQLTVPPDLTNQSIVKYIRGLVSKCRLFTNLGTFQIPQN